MVDGVAWSGDIVNKGKITASGKSIGGHYRVAGIIGHSTCSLPAEARFINLGEIEFTGDAGIKNDVPGISYVGGILGESANAGVTNAEVYCTINAPKVDYLGYVIASPRSETVIAKGSFILYLPFVYFLYVKSAVPQALSQERAGDAK